MVQILKISPMTTCAYDEPSTHSSLISVCLSYYNDWVRVRIMVTLIVRSHKLDISSSGECCPFHKKCIVLCHEGISYFHRQEPVLLFLQTLG